METDLALTLAVLRVIRGWTQEELAEASGVRPSAISDYERGRKTPELRSLRRLLAAMEMPLAAVDEAQGCVGRIRRLQGAFAGESGLLKARVASREDLELAAAVARWDVDQLAEDAAKVVARLVRMALVDGSASATVPRFAEQETGEAHGD
jgi:transcriptional regulator with XRE-family HTH domain